MFTGKTTTVRVSVACLLLAAPSLSLPASAQVLNHWEWDCLVVARTWDNRPIHRGQCGPNGRDQGDGAPSRTGRVGLTPPESPPSGPPAQPPTPDRPNPPSRPDNRPDNPPVGPVAGGGVPPLRQGLRNRPILRLPLPAAAASSPRSMSIHPPLRTSPTVRIGRDTAGARDTGADMDMAAAAGPITVVATVAAGLIAAIMLVPAAVRIVIQAVAVTVAIMVILAVAAARSRSGWC